MEYFSIIFNYIKLRLLLLFKKDVGYVVTREDMMKYLGITEEDMIKYSD